MPSRERRKTSSIGSQGRHVQTRTVPSSCELTNRLSGRKFVFSTEAPKPCRTMGGLLSVVLQIRVIASLPLVTTRRPSGPNATLHTTP